MARTAKITNATEDDMYFVQLLFNSPFKVGSVYYKNFSPILSHSKISIMESFSFLYRLAYHSGEACNICVPFYEYMAMDALEKLRQRRPTTYETAEIILECFQMIITDLFKRNSIINAELSFRASRSSCFVALSLDLDTKVRLVLIGEFVIRVRTRVLTYDENRMPLESSRKAFHHCSHEIYLMNAPGSTLESIRTKNKTDVMLEFGLNPYIGRCSPAQNNSHGLKMPFPIRYSEVTSPIYRGTRIFRVGPNLPPSFYDRVFVPQDELSKYPHTSMAPMLLSRGCISNGMSLSSLSFSRAGTPDKIIPVFDLVDYKLGGQAIEATPDLLGTLGYRKEFVDCVERRTHARYFIQNPQLF